MVNLTPLIPLSRGEGEVTKRANALLSSHSGSNPVRATNLVITLPKISFQIFFLVVDGRYFLFTVW